MQELEDQQIKKNCINVNVKILYHLLKPRCVCVGDVIFVVFSVSGMVLMKQG